MRVDLLTREYPPHVYGGAGVHVLELAKVLRGLVDDLRVQAFDGPREPGTDGADPGVTGHSDLPQLEGANAALRTLGVDLEIAAACEGSDLVHSHTWYANFAGHVASLLGDIPHVISAHSLEPLRPWKAEQLGGGYRLSSYVEKTAYEAASAIVAVSNGMRDDILRCYPSVDPERVHVIHNGIDLNKWHAPEGEAGDELRARVLAEHGIDPTRRTVVFVGRITRQKGLPYFLRAARLLPDDVQLVLCAGAPDTPEIAAEVEGLVAELRAMKLKEAAKKVEDGIEETLTYCDFPSEHWTRIRTNNVIERLNREIRRRTRVVGTFPDGNSALMLVCARLRHVAGTQWGSKKYMNMKHLEAALDDAFIAD